MKDKGKEEIKKQFDDLLGEPIDWSNYEQLAKDCWLFLTNDKMPDNSKISKAAFLHEVKVMIESAVLFEKKKEAIAFVEWCDDNYFRSSNSYWYEIEHYGKQIYDDTPKLTTEQLYDLFKKQQS